MPDQVLALTQEQHQTLAPQLRQSLEMLQVPVLELRTLIQKELLQNPVLEEKGADMAPLEAPAADTGHEEAKELNFKKEFDVLTRMDKEAYDYFTQEYEPYDTESEKRRNYALDVRTSEESLQEHLSKQMDFLNLSERDRKIGDLLIGSINEDGYLNQSVEDLAVSAGYEPNCLYDVLAVIQDFDPVGVGARSLKECLLLQLQRLGNESLVAVGIVNDHLDLLAAKNYGELARRLNVKPEEIRQAEKIIATLNPRPGTAFGSDISPYIVPDVFVEKRESGYCVALNNDQIPQLRISKCYRDLMADGKSSEEVRKYIRDKMRSGVFIIKSIYQRQQTLRRVATAIVKAQGDFFDSGVAALKPLTMSEVARQVGLHETTICRCVANKYMKTPGGVFEMKYFFTPGLKTSDGKTVSNKAVQDMIAGMVADEDSAKPLSDQDIFEKLNALGLRVARRTVAKYRMAMKIPPSHARK